MCMRTVAIGDQQRALGWLKDAADKPQPYESHGALMYLKNNIWNARVLRRRELLEVRSRLGFRE